METISNVLKYFPLEINNYISNEVFKSEYNKASLQEIRLRVNRPIILNYRKRDIVLEYIITSEDILNILERLCENSLYAYKNQICQGFLTIKGGHRVGIVGTVVIENNKIINVNYISSLNIRIAREVLNCSNDVLDEIIDGNNKTIYNTLIVSPPGKGKTTMLRDIIRQISNGIPEKNFPGITVGLIDERGEIASTYRGIPQNDVGIRTDIISNSDKQRGIEMLIRSMAPKVIACDEIGCIDDIQAIKRAMISGVKGIFTMHGNTIEDVKQNKIVNNLIAKKQIEKIIFL